MAVCEISFMDVVKVHQLFCPASLYCNINLFNFLAWGAALPFPTCDSCRGAVVPPDEQGLVPVRLLRESSKMLVDPGSI